MLSTPRRILVAVTVMCGLGAAQVVSAGAASPPPRPHPKPHKVPHAIVRTKATKLQPQPRNWPKYKHRRAHKSSVKLHRAVPAATTDPPTVVSLTFDDGNADVLTANSILQAHGYNGTYYINSGTIGASGKLTWPQVQQLAAAGNEVGGHTVNHLNLTTLSTADATFQVGQDRQNIINRALLTPTDFAYPYGATNSTVEGIVKGQGYSSARVIGNLVTPTSCSGCDYGETIPPIDPYAIRTSDSVKSSWTAQTLENLVTGVINHGGGWQPLVFHHVGTSTANDPYQVDPAVLSTFLDWLKTQPVTVQTVQQVMNTTPPPPPPPPPPASNLIQNPSLETVVGGKPACFQMYTGGGTNTTTWTAISSPVHSGSIAERGVETAWSSGGAVMVSSLDSGGCAPAAQPGHTYAGSAWYQSDHPVYLEFYYHNSTGWHWWTDRQFPASSSWAQASMTTPAAPAGADLLSIGLEMPSTGTFYMDDFSLSLAS